MWISAAPALYGEVTSRSCFVTPDVTSAVRSDPAPYPTHLRFSDATDMRQKSGDNYGDKNATENRPYIEAKDH